MYELKNTKGKVIYQSETASTIGKLLREAIKNNVEIKDVDLREAFLIKDKLSNGVFINVDFSRANVGNCVANNAIFNNCNFSESICFDASFYGSHFDDCDFSKSDCRLVDFTKSSLQGCKFQQTNLFGANLQKIESLIGSDFRGAKLKETVFEDVYMDSSDSYIELPYEPEKEQEEWTSHIEVKGTL